MAMVTAMTMVMVTLAAAAAASTMAAAAATAMVGATDNNQLNEAAKEMAVAAAAGV
jgi:hypothetical protein